MPRHSGIGPGTYQHLDAEYPLVVKGGGIEVRITADAAAEAACAANYGVHRLLSALVHARRAQAEKRGHREDGLADAIERLLLEGWY